jgi:transcriptional regulator with XRE-family HTH domain
LRAWRERKLLTRAELATRSGLAAITITKIESGEVAGAQFSTVRKLAEALNITPEELISTNPTN